MITDNPDKKEFTSETECTNPETEVTFEAVDISQVKQVTIGHEVIISALDYKMAKIAVVHIATPSSLTPAPRILILF